MLNKTTYSIAAALSSFDIKIEDVESNALLNDSRKVTSGNVFAAVTGTAESGQKYIDDALNQGATLVISQCHCQQAHGNIIERVVDRKKVQVVQFFELDKHLISLAQQYYGFPHRSMRMIGVTGTNGKTSTTQILANCFDILHQPSAVIGTTGAGSIGALQPINNTTPGPTELNALLAQFHQHKMKNVVMEVSSHALDQHRINPEMIDVAVFTNLSRDHLDYHQTMAAYADAKFKLFTGISTQSVVINGDDEYGQKWLSERATQSPVIVFGRSEHIKNHARFIRAKDIEHSHAGLRFTIETQEGCHTLSSQLIGDFNIDNLLAAMGVLMASGVALNDIAEVLPKVKPCDGRMEIFSHADQATCIVDYAHTPDALKNALKACRQHCQGQLWVVFGCGGDRDKGKRALMGAVGEQYADHIVITNDNPRSEAPELITSDILSGCKRPEKVTVMLERTQAVRSTLSNANKNDIVLLAGKGHEETIQIGNEIIDYNERTLVKSIYEQEAYA